ncbi:MAG: cytochrome c5 family protein [Pseudomonadota bacterium]
MSNNDKQFATVFVAVLGALAVLAIILYFIAGMLTSDLSDYKPEEVILENIKPVGEVNIAGESSADEAAVEMVTADAAAAEPLSPEQIYQSNCFACHGTGAAGAPKTGDAAAWAPRIAQGTDTLVANSINGLNAMPPKGLCMACSDDDLKAVVEYIVGQSQ